MNYNLLFVLALFIAIWQTILFIGNALNKSLNAYKPFNIFMYAVSLTALATHFMNIW